MNRFRQLLTVICLVLTLAGAQLVQASPLHDHLSHVAGCALCHYDNSGCGLPIASFQAPTPVPVLVFIAQPVAAITNRIYPAFQGRAPPRHSR